MNIYAVGITVEALDASTVIEVKAANRSQARSLAIHEWLKDGSAPDLHGELVRYDVRGPFVCICLPGRDDGDCPTHGGL